MLVMLIRFGLVGRHLSTHYIVLEKPKLHLKLGSALLSCSALIA